MKSKQKIRTLFGLLLLIAILAFFGFYLNNHPAIINTLSRANPWLIATLILCYGVMMLWWMEIYNTTLSLCGNRLGNKENMLLSIYSTLANFFLPLQSGPGVRAGYLKKRHKVPITSYIFASLIYYAIYAIISAAFLFVASTYWWLAIPSAILAGIISYVIIYLAKKRFTKKGKQLSFNFTKKKMLRLFLLTLGQLATQALIYGIELNSLQIPITIRRVISYTGAANFSLFVSLTPGAIGFREAFLEFSRQLHHFSTNAILAANIIDRGVFIIFLGILFLIMLATHARDKLKI